MQRLIKIQQELKAPKSQYNTFGSYFYRSCEDILEALKPLLAERELSLLISDSIVNFGDRYYIQATVRLHDNEKVIAETTALAREALTKKGMDDAQITGAASSYARKYALNGMFCIDDTKDPDTKDNSKEGVKVAKETFKAPAWDKGHPDNDNKDWLDDHTFDSKVVPWIKESGLTDVSEIMKQLRLKYKVAKKYEELVKDVLN